jgi:hypothetical protein
MVDSHADSIGNDSIIKMAQHGKLNSKPKNKWFRFTGFVGYTPGLLIGTEQISQFLKRKKIVHYIDI